MEIHYGVVQIEEQWMVISDGLRSGPYETREIAEQTARRMADQAAGLEVQLHIQGQSGELRREAKAQDE
jgi:hypothetical protein